MTKENDRNIVAHILKVAKNRYGLVDEDCPGARQKIQRTLNNKFKLKKKKDSKNGRDIVDYNSAPCEADYLLDFDKDLNEYFKKLKKKAKKKSRMSEEDAVYELSQLTGRTYLGDILKYPKLRSQYSKDELTKMLTKEQWKQIKENKWNEPDLEDIKLKEKLKVFDRFFDKNYKRPSPVTIETNFKEIKRVINLFVASKEMEKNKIPDYFYEVLADIRKYLDFDWSKALNEFFDEKDVGFSKVEFNWNQYLKDVIKHYFFVDYDIGWPTDFEYYLNIQNPQDYFMLKSE